MYKHGVFAYDVPTSVLPPAKTEASIPVVFGTAPIGMTDEKNVNKPVLCFTYAEAVKAMGYVPPVAGANGLKKHEYTLCEAMKVHFSLFNVAPIVLVNVLDPSSHKKAATAVTVNIDANTGSAVIKETGIIPSTVTITPSSETAYKLGTDYELSFDDDGFLVIQSLGSKLEWKCATGEELTFAAQKTDASAVTAEDIVGGVDLSGNRSGLELIDTIFPQFRIIPGMIVAPGYSSEASVSAVMAAKAENMNGLFQCVAIVDADTKSTKDYTKVPEWKNKNSVMSPSQIVCWPKVKLDDVEYFLSTQTMSLMARVDSQNEDVPYVSPSNHALQMTAAIVDDGTEIWLDQQNAAYLNGQGVVTALNFIGGWKLWGNRTAAYPAVTDPKDAFICIRRMFNFIKNTFITTFWQKVDGPVNPRLIKTVLVSANIWLNGMAAKGFVLGGRLGFFEEENPRTDLMDGKLCFHCHVTPPPPAVEMNFKIEFDIGYFDKLFK